ncbi:hypothetical protein [Georgenia faecalis]|uniref:hypothetical protein n=1 Tax=Georgenia faecalis TaxID=2483799 RepID=UPI000FD77B18|nr:hypothetical protein [Georgenia faecalis]
MTATPLSPEAPADRPVSIEITWTELLRTPDRALRRLLAGRYRRSTDTARVIDHLLADVTTSARRHQLDAMLDAEIQRLEADALWRYEHMASAYGARIRAGERPRPSLYIEEEVPAA